MADFGSSVAGGAVGAGLAFFLLLIKEIVGGRQQLTVEVAHGACFYARYAEGGRRWEYCLREDSGAYLFARLIVLAQNLSDKDDAVVECELLFPPGKAGAHATTRRGLRFFGRNIGAHELAILNLLFEFPGDRFRELQAFDFTTGTPKYTLHLKSSRNWSVGPLRRGRYSKHISLTPYAHLGTPGNEVEAELFDRSWLGS